MLPYLKIPITLAGNPAEKEEDKEVIARIQPATIGSYHPGFYWGTFIYLQNGQVLCSRIECEDLEKQIQAYWKEVSAPPPLSSNKKSHLLITK